MAHPGGAPRKYDPLVLAEQLHQYIDEEDDPQITGFCVPRDRPSRETVYTLAKECHQLSDAITRAKVKCEHYLCGPNCKIHPKIAGIRLATNHGMAERVQQEISGPGGNALEIKVTITDD